MVYMKEGERVDDLYHQGLRVIQNPVAHGFSMDAVILADFAQIHNGDHVIDLGTGCGVISLLLAHKVSQCHIVALELMPSMADMAGRSVELNGLSRQISVICGDIRKAANNFGKSTFDVVVSNPPYYKEGAGRISKNPLRAAARSETYCSLDELLDATVALLKPLGRFYIVHRAERLSEVLSAGEFRKLHCTQLRMVQSRIDCPANLFMAQFTLGGREQLVVKPPLVVYAGENMYSSEMCRIYQGWKEDSLVRNSICGSDAHR